MVAGVSRTRVAGADWHRAGQQLRSADCGTASARTAGTTADHAIATVSANHWRGDRHWGDLAQQHRNERSQPAGLRQLEPGRDMDTGFLGHLSQADGGGARAVAGANLGAASSSLDAG